MIHNPYVGMRVRFVDDSVGQPYIRYLGTLGTVEKILPVTHYRNTMLTVRFDLDGERTELYYWRFDYADLKEAKAEQERQADQKRRQEHADRYL